MKRKTFTLFCLIFAMLVAAGCTAKSSASADEAVFQETEETSIAMEEGAVDLDGLTPEQLVAALPDVDIAVINGNYAIEGGLHVSEALAVEANTGLAATTYGNIIATSKDKANNEALKTLVEVLQSAEIKAFIEATYDGAVVPLN